MRQVLFFIPLKSLSDALPDLPWLAYLALAALAVGLGGWLARRASEAGKGGAAFQVGGMVLGVLLALAAAIKAFGNTDAVPIYGYGTMLFVAFLACTWLASRLGAREGIDPLRVQDMAIWIFIFGLIGARFTFMAVDYWGERERRLFTWEFPTILFQFVRVWDGGLVFYGSAIGGLIGYYLCYLVVLRKHGVSSWKMADVIAPCAALGLALGRLGCLLNGCCYGNVAVCEGCPGISFPLSSPPRFDMVNRGYQTAAGFTLKNGAGDKDPIVGDVEPGVPLQTGDVIQAVNGKKIGFDQDTQQERTIHSLFQGDWPRGQNVVSLKVQRSDAELVYDYRTVSLHPTQLYESISMLLVFLLLLAYYPLRAQPGAVMVLFMFCYASHRFLNEMLRTDTPPNALGLTLSQTISVLVLGAAVVLAIWLRIKSLHARPKPLPPTP